MGRVRRARTVLCIAAVALLAACGGNDESSDAPDTAGAEEPGSTGEPSSTEVADDVSSSDDAAADTVAEVGFTTDFGDVCRGVKLPGATPYDPARTGIHPLVTMTGESPSYETSLALLPDQWDPVIGEESTVELVACLDLTASTLVQTCEGYTDDNDEDTGNVVEMYDASYDVRLIAATSGEVLTTTQLDATDDMCPMFVFFDENEKVKPVYAQPTDALTEFLVPFVET